jgi:hypothetical protein
VPANTLNVLSPAGGSTIASATLFKGQAGSQWVNIAAFDGNNLSNKISGDTTPVNGSYALSIDSTKLANGSGLVAIVAFSVPAGQAGGTSAEVDTKIYVQNATTPPTPAPTITSNPTPTQTPTSPPSSGKAPFVMGAENKMGPIANLSKDLQCDLTLQQKTTGWTNDWAGWESNGGGDNEGAVFDTAAKFLQSDSRHAVEFSLAPWPGNGSGYNYAACARGEYNSHYAALGRTLASKNITHAAIRFGYEWDGYWFKWGTGLYNSNNANASEAGGTALDYARCFAQFDTQLQSAGQASGKKVFWRTVMNPIHDSFTGRINALQQVLDTAGGARSKGGHVDIFGIDIYDYAPSSPDPAMTAAVNFTKKNGLPLSVPEWGVAGNSSVSNVDANGEVFIQKMFNFLSNPANNIAYASYFNANPSVGAAGNHSLSAGSGNGRSRAKFTSLFGNGKVGCGANARARFENP